MTRTREQVIWDFVQDWLEKAKGDLRAAEHLLDLEPGDYFTSAFHAQPAAEKYLKAFLVRHQIPFPKTHDIQYLLELVSQADPAVTEELSSAVMLTPFGVEFRYPGELLVHLELAQQSVEEANRVQKVILESLEDYLSQGRPSDPAS